MFEPNFSGHYKILGNASQWLRPCSFIHA